MLWIIPLSFLIAFEMIADVLAKEYSLKGYWYLWVAAILGYIVANSFWLYAIRHGSGLARGAIIFSVATGIIAILIGVYYYHESVSRTQFAGLILGIISITLIFWE
jgi:drug/metabolite transporter (DMT)-like permease